MLKLKRKSKNVGLIGRQSRGKSTFQAWYAYMKYLEGVLVISNTKYRFPHVYIDSLNDIENIKIMFPIDLPKLFIGDDLEFWFNSRGYKTKTNLKLNDILIFWGKINCSIMYSSKRGNVDIGLRDITDEFYWLDLIQYKGFNIPEGYEYLDNLAIRLEGIDSEGLELAPKYLINLHKWVQLFDTQDMLSSLTTT